MFHSARIKLTLWYLLIIMLVSVSFSLVIYRVLVNEVSRFERLQRFRIESRLRDRNIFPGRINSLPVPMIISSPELVDETKHRIVYMLAAVNLGILVMSGGCGYLLSGRTLKPIRDMIEEQNRFISDASHELRTPLTSLKSAYEVYLRQRPSDTGEARKLAHESITEVDRLQILSDSLLRLTRYQQGGIANYREKVELIPVIEQAIKQIRRIAGDRKLAVVNTAGDLSFAGNFQSLTDLLVILLDNAVKYTKASGRVKLTAEKIDNSVLILVSDNGIGISSRDLPHVFDRFYRADAARSRSTTGGYGLGLAIAKQIVAAHRGTITVRSQQLRGTTFTVRLPLFS